MEGGAAAAAVEVLVQNLINVSKEEISLIRGLEKNAEKLKKTLAMIQSFLDDAEKKFITDDSVKRWLKELEAVAFNADNTLDELNYHLLSKKMKKSIIQTEKKKKVPACCFPSFNHYARRRRMALQIKEINMRFESTRKNATELGLESKLAVAPAAPDDAGSVSNPFAVDPIFTGRDDDVSKIVEMLTRGSTEQVLSVLPIVGMGGLGKTALARNVFNHGKIKTHFGERIWVHVPKSFKLVSVLKVIHTTLTLQKVEVEISEVILRKLQEALGAKTCLLVLDDVWNQEQQKWQDFQNSWEDFKISWSGITSVKANAIIVTTRNTEVASIVQTLSSCELRGLPEDSCWSIIKAKAFGEEDIPPGFETIGRNIARRCQGLPLAAKVVGGVLRRRSEDDWLSIQENWLSDVGGHENNISKILKLSFDHLSPPSLKKCFVYCSIFHKGETINREELIELWMAEGFLQPDRGRDMETLGNKIFNLLLQNSLLQVLERDDYGNVTACSMHDLVHDVASSVLGFPKVNDNISDGLYQARYIRWECNGDESSCIPKEQAKYLRAVFYRGGISDITFSDFKCLHALTLMNYDVKELPDSIRELIHLRYLNISDTIIEYLPDSIGELYHLQTVRAETMYLSKLPSTLKYLINLRHLHVPGDIGLPPQLGTLTSLQTLPYFKVGDEEGHLIAELGSLKNLKGKLKIYNLEKVRGEEEAKSACIFRKRNIVRLELRWDDESGEGEIRNDENVLEGLQPHPNLKRLKIYVFKGRRFPLWTLNMEVQDEAKHQWVRLDNLMKIKLSSCEESEEIPILGHLPHLKSLYLSDLNKVKTIGSSFYGIDKCSSNNGVQVVFPALQRLKLSDMPNLTEWVRVEFRREVKVFPRLEFLNIKNCKQLRSAPSQFTRLKELEIKMMDSDLPLANILCGGIELTSLTKFTIETLDGLVFLPERLFRNNHNLSVLEIRNCPNLAELPDDLHTLNSLEVLEIEGCRNLKSIPSYPSSSGGGGGVRGGQSQGFASLRSLSIRDCEELINLPCEMVESRALSLETLKLHKLSSVMNFQMIIECLHNMPRLTELEIADFPKFIITSSTEIGSLLSLQKLTIAFSASDSWDCVSFKKTVDGILQLGFQSLRELYLIGMGDWDTLPDELQHLTALSNLSIRNFGMEDLPEWFGNLSSLCTLCLSDCKKLRHLPSMEVMRRLTMFTYLDIKNCPVLKQRCIEQQSEYCDSEWPKISDLAFVYVDGRRINTNLC